MRPTRRSHMGEGRHPQPPRTSLDLGVRRDVGAPRVVDDGLGMHAVFGGASVADGREALKGGIMPKNANVALWLIFVVVALDYCGL